MFILKKKYFLIIENIKNINLKNIKIRNKFNIIYRTNKNKIDKISDLLNSGKYVKKKEFNFYLLIILNLANY